MGEKTIDSPMLLGKKNIKMCIEKKNKEANVITHE